MSNEESAAFVLPTQIAVHRYQQMRVEAILNTPYQVTNEKTPLVYLLEEGKQIEEVIGLLELNDDDAELAQDLLEDVSKGGDIDEIYGPRGGVLNVLLPTTSPDMDLTWQKVQKGEEGAPSAEAFTVLPNELFSGLTPGQVWAGTGRLEIQLADLFFKGLWEEEMKDKKFPTSGAANTEWLGRLRLWAYNPARVTNFRGRIVDLIQQERRENLIKRRELCDLLGLKCAFSPPEL